MTTIDKSSGVFTKLNPYQVRKFLDDDVDLTDLSKLKKIYDLLLQRKINSSEELEKWILDRSEFDSALDQVAAILYIKMTCFTDDEAHSRNYKDFIEKIIPEIKPLDDMLNQKYLDEIQTYKIDLNRYEVITRAIKTNVDIFIKKNIPLQTKEDLLSQEYQTICGAMTVNFDGEERTMPQMTKYLLESDRDLRERAWKTTIKRRLADKDKLDSIFDQMLEVRANISDNLKFTNYCEYKFKSLLRFDYTPGDCKKYHSSVEKLVLPLWKEILKRRKCQLNLDDLRPWDIAVDPIGMPPLKPFEKVDDLVTKCKKIFYNVNENLGKQFSFMIENNLLDLASRKGKAPGGYQSTLNESRKPFIFMNAVGTDNDVRTLLHEAGHAFHSLACAHDPLLFYRHAPMEFNEVASMTMELLGGEFLSVFYSEEEYKRSKISHLEDVVFILLWVATIDSFQHWIYENPSHNSKERRGAWIRTIKRFETGLINWDGLEEEHAFLWHKQLHIFEVPFYYIEYGIAQLGALQVWLNSKKDWEKAILDYQKALSLGGSRPLSELFSTANIKFDFSENTINPLINIVKEELNKLI